MSARASGRLEGSLRGKDRKDDQEGRERQLQYRGNAPRDDAIDRQPAPCSRCLGGPPWGCSEHVHTYHNPDRSEEEHIDAVGEAHGRHHARHEGSVSGFA
jgi:hypothetical protein